MDFRSVEEIGMQSSWKPVTPAKPMPIRPQPNSNDRQGSQPGRTSNWPDSVGLQAEFYQGSPQITSNGVMDINSMGFVDQNRGINTLEEAMSGRHRGPGDIVFPCAEDLSSRVIADWNNISFADLIALSGTNSGVAAILSQRGNVNAASSPSIPPLNSQIHRSLQKSNPPLANQNFSISSNMLNNSNYSPHKLQYGIPVHYRPTFDLNSPLADAASNGNIFFQFSPLTPAQGRREQNQHSEIANIRIEKGSDLVKNLQQNVVEQQSKNNGIEIQCKDSLLQSVVDLSSAAVSTRLKENQIPDKTEEHGIDLNKTPQQKPKRRKIRPRVVVEGKKPRKTPNSNVKQSTPKENPSGKRKYVRKNGLKSSNSPSANVAGEVNTNQVAAKPCKRDLNFELEEEARDGSHGSTMCYQEGLLDSIVDSSSRLAFNSNSEPQAQEICPGVKSSSVTKSTVQLFEGLEVIVENSPAGLPFDLNCSLTQALDDIISLPDKPAPTTPPPTRREAPRENLNALMNTKNNTGNTGVSQNSVENICPPRHQHIHPDAVFQTGSANGNHENEVRSIFQNDIRLMSQNNLNCISQVQLTGAEQARGSKRGYSHTIDETNLHAMNLRRSPLSSLQSCQQMLLGNEYHRNSGTVELHFPETNKKNRTDKDQKTANSSMYSSICSFLEGPMVRKKNVTNADHFESQAKNRGLEPQLGNINGTKDHQNGAGNSVPNACSQAMANQHNGRVQNTWAGPVSQNQNPSWATLGELQHSETTLRFNQPDLTTKQRSNGPTKICELTSLTTTPDCNKMPKTPPKMAPISGDKLGIKNFPGPQDCIEDLAADNHVKKRRGRPRKRLDLVNSVSNSSKNNESLHRHETFVYDYRQPSTKSRGSLEIPWQFNVSIDEIVQKLEHLSINNGRKTVLVPEQNALVPFGREGQMVPYEGLFDPIKKRQLRPKVDLDPETDRVWKLLMGNESSDGVEGTKRDKEKWWEEERKVFRGRADSFIARMHLIQGDRRFTKWKGSVVDSVIGVFLTQNVSDHLSSSAFMSLVARFPLKSTSNSRSCHKEQTEILVEEPEISILDSNDNINWQEKLQSKPLRDQDFVNLREVHIEERETGHSNESFGSNVGGSFADISKGVQIDISESWELCHQSLENRVETLTPGTGFESLIEAEERRALEDVVSSQNSVVSSQNSVDSFKLQRAEGKVTTRTENASLLENEDRRALEDVVSSQNSVDSFSLCIDERIRSCSYFNSDTDLTPRCTSNSLNDPTSFTELLQMEGTTMLQEYCSLESGGFSINLNSESGHNQSVGKEQDKKRLSMGGIDACEDLFSIYPPSSHLPNTPSSNYFLQMTPDSGRLEVECPEMLGTESRFSWSSNASQITAIKDLDSMRKRVIPTAETVKDQKKSSTNAKDAPTADTYPLLSKHLEHSLTSAGQEARLEKHQDSFNNLQRARDGTFQHQGSTVTEPRNHVGGLGVQAQRGSRMQQAHSNFKNFSIETLHAGESTTLVDKQTYMDDKMVKLNQKEQVIHSSNKVSSGTTTNASKARGRPEKEKKKEFDWDSLRRDVYHKGLKRERNNNTMDSLDWEAVRCADVKEIAKAIKERGMNNMLAERIKDFLNRLVRDHGSIDLEWLRDVPPDKAKEYLLNIRGLGLKSVECVRLLTLHHLAFPVDTNVGRIAVRLGWVPLQPLPESLQLHLLELYPMLESIQKYLWPRLCTLDQLTLYELHYQMITFGKVFCTKSKPNCNACPMRAECKHFASAFASARLSLPGPEEKGIVTSSPIAANQNPSMGANPMPLPLLEADLLSGTRFRRNECEPIIEEPATPENEYTEIPESDIEDAFYECPNEIPSIDLNIEELTLNLKNYMQENKMELQEGDVSNALVALTPQAASIPTTKLKNVNRLRTEHQVYELPDSHPLLEGVPRRDPDDHCSYLLAIWTPGETAESIQPPERCGSQVSGNLCNEKTCFSCNSIREANSQIVRGTLLIPCKTAMRGSFPLNGTYFQVNEVFADHDSSLNPIDVPRAWIWNLPRRTVLFGTSIPTIFKGQTAQEIQNCFWKGYVCVRGFDQKTRAPRPLMARLHFPASKLARNKTNTGKE
ncbi:HhH-GPD domain [Macleaya cordata]|uniref:HhH-GPD domain n=1 Tax=Macleaya cordata TaxID=56857 RepID=A0A200R566_MACCD|nr:HhH-GPD domain [Macleaya cordata]